MAAASTLFLHQILHRRPPPASLQLSPSSCPSAFLKPLKFRIFSTHSSNTNTNTNTNNNYSNSLSPHQRSSCNHSITTTTTARMRTTLFRSRSVFLSHAHTLSQPIKASAELEREVELEGEIEDEDEDEDEIEEEIVDGSEEAKEEEVKGVGSEGAGLDKEGLHSLRVRTKGSALPSLTVREKKELASYAHSLGKKLKSQLVGKSGVNVNVAASFVETLEANELLKIKVHRTCPGELADVVGQLEELTGSVVVGKIGRTVILYRPSPTKLEAEEKKRQHLKMFEKRRLRARPTFQARSTRPQFSGRGRRGISRVSDS